MLNSLVCQTGQQVTFVDIKKFQADFGYVFYHNRSVSVFNQGQNAYICFVACFAFYCQQIRLVIEAVFKDGKTVFT